MISFKKKRNNVRSLESRAELSSNVLYMLVIGLNRYLSICYLENRKNSKRIFYTFLQKLSKEIGDEKSLSEHLQLPIQRINDYQLLLKVVCSPESK